MTKAKVAEPVKIIESMPNSVPFSELVPSDKNIRSEYSDIAELAESIKGMGLINPLTVRWEQRGDEPVPVITAGHRRYRALQLLVDSGELSPDYQIQVSERYTDAADDTLVMLVENLQRSDISPLDEARGYLQMVQVYKLKQKELAVKTGKSQAHISKRLALLKLPDNVQALIGNKLSIDLGYELSQLPPGEATDALFAKVVKNGTCTQYDIDAIKKAHDRAVEQSKFVDELAARMISYVPAPRPEAPEGKVYGSLRRYTLKDIAEYVPAAGDVVVFLDATQWRDATIDVFPVLTPTEADLLAAEHQRELDAMERERVASLTPHGRWLEDVRARNRQYDDACEDVSFARYKMVYRQLVALKQANLETIAMNAMVELFPVNPFSDWRVMHQLAEIIDADDVIAWCNENLPARVPLVWALAGVVNEEGATDLTEPFLQLAIDAIPLPAEPDHGIEPWQDGDVWITDRPRPELVTEPDPDFVDDED